VTDPSPRYITTALPYVNARPHLGFTLEAVLADTLARHARRAGRDVRFVSGTDEHSLKNVLAAERAGVPVADLVAQNARAFQALGGALDLSLDDFVRTSADPRHRPAVEAVWAACAARGDLYRRAYRGRYCVGCEQFFEPEDLAGGVCPEHGIVPEVVEEENWFFRLSRHREELLDALSQERAPGWIRRPSSPRTAPTRSATTSSGTSAPPRTATTGSTSSSRRTT
jgi:methionyl-tRNA synthetase